MNLKKSEIEITYENCRLLCGRKVYPSEKVEEMVRLLKDDFKLDTFWQKVCERIDKRTGDLE